MSRKVSLQHNQKPSLQTEVRINFLTEALVKSGWTKYDLIQYAKTEWNLSDCQAEKYYYATCKNIIPKDPEAYREAMIARNLTTLENILKKCLDRENFKQANEVIKTINTILGVGGKQVEIQDKNTNNVIKISFGD